MNFFGVEKQFTVYIFYGSEKGFVESIANVFLEKLKIKTKLNNIKIDIINNFFNYKINKGDFIFFLISTTGDGELPSNAKNFRKLAYKNKDIFNDDTINYSLFAFGDSNYRSFCHAGKTLDRILKSNGGVKFMETEYFDDAIDENQKIELWMENNINYITDYKNNLYDWFVKIMGGG